MLKPPEEKDEMAEKQREAQEIANAEAMQRMGFEVKMTPDGEFIYSDKPEQVDSPPSPTFGSPDPLAGAVQNTAARIDGTPQKPA